MVGWHRRSQPEAPDVLDLDDHLAPLTVDEAAYLVRLVAAEFSAHGCQIVYSNGEVVCHYRSFSLRNIAAAAKQAPRSAWPNLVRRHVAQLIEVASQPLPSSAEEAASHLVLRLAPTGALPSPIPSFAQELVPDVWIVPALRFRTHVVDIVDEALIASYGGISAVRARGFANVRRLPDPVVTTLQTDSDRTDARVNLLHYEDAISSARILLLDEVLRAEGLDGPLYGVLIAAPTRHLLAIHLIQGEGLVPALRKLQQLAHEQFVHGIGGLSPHVYYYSTTGRLTQITVTGDDGAPVIVLTEELAEVFTKIGLL